MGPFTGLLQNKWLVALLVSLLVIIAIETIIIAALMSGWSLGGQSFPKLSLNPPVATNCSSLSHHLVSQNADNRTVSFDCSTETMNISAFSVDAPFKSPSHPELIRWAIAEPIFNLPPGYLNLGITGGPPKFSCASGFSSIISGKSYPIDTDTGYFGYDYCAVISNSVNPIEGFKIQWVEGTPPPPTPTYEVSASSYHLTIPAGQTGSCTLTITSHNGFNGTLVFSSIVHPFVPMNVTGLPFITLQPSSIFLPRNGVVRVEATIVTYSNTTTTTGYLAWVLAQNGGGVGLDISVT